MSAQSSIFQFAELLVKHILDAGGKEAVFRPSNFMTVDTDVVTLIYELSARGYLSKTRNSKGVRVRIPPDSPLYTFVVKNCTTQSVQCVRQVAEFLLRFL